MCAPPTLTNILHFELPTNALWQDALELGSVRKWESNSVTRTPQVVQAPPLVAPNDEDDLLLQCDIDAAIEASGHVVRHEEFESICRTDLAPRQQRAAMG